MLPNKVISFRKSVIPKMLVILNVLEKGSCGVIELYNTHKSGFSSMNEFLSTIEYLFALNKISLTDEGVLSYVAPDRI